MTLFAVLVATPALACKPAPDAAWYKSPEENYRTHPVVFVGELVSANQWGGKPGGDGPNTGRYRVIKALKGQLGKEVSYTSAWHSCGFFDDKGHILLVFAGPLTKGQIHMSAITPRKSFDDEASALAFAARLMRAN